MCSRYLPLFSAALIFGLAFSHAAVAKTNFNFPEKEVPVLRIDEYYSEANKDKRPMLLVYPDGRVVRSVSNEQTDDFEFTLSESKFEQILNRVFVKNDIMTISDETIKNEISPRHRAMRPSRTTFKVTASTANGSHVINYGSSWVHDRLGLGRKRHPDAKHLQRFLRVEDTCRELANLALIGGEEAFQSTVKKANEKFKEAYPDGPGISDKDLFSVRRNKDGEIAIRFRIERKVVAVEPVSVWVRKPQSDQEPSIEIKADKPFLMRDVLTPPPNKVK